MAQSSFCIFLENLIFYSRIGVGEQERLVGNEFSVTVKVWYDTAEFIAESLDTSISYADIYEEVKDVMKEEFLLLETVAVAISERISNRWRQVTEMNMKIVKRKPPVSGIIGDCGIEYFWKKS